MSSPSAILEPDEQLRMRRFLIGSAIGAVLLAAATTLAVGLIAPDGGWTVALGIGAMIGFWMSPLGGALIGNGYHEAMKNRARAQATAAAEVDPADEELVAA